MTTTRTRGHHAAKQSTQQPKKVAAHPQAAAKQGVLKKSGDSKPQAKKATGEKPQAKKDGDANAKPAAKQGADKKTAKKSSWPQHTRGGTGVNLLKKTAADRPQAASRRQAPIAAGNWAATLKHPTSHDDANERLIEKISGATSRQKPTSRDVGSQHAC